MVYSGSDKSKEEIFKLVKERFNIDADPKNVKFLKLKTHTWMEPQHYPSFTLIRQSWANIVTCYEALTQFPCDVFIDTVGVGSAYPVIKVLFGVKLLSYTHYPTVSLDMLKQTDNQSFNNKYRGVLAKGKKVYLYVLIQLYKLCGNFADWHATNSSWTDNHIKSMWGKCRVTKIYPPCDTSDIMDKVSLETPRKNILVSFAQFRPEKQHDLQLAIWKESLLSLPKDAKFVMVGATRGREDELLVEKLRQQAEILGIKDTVEFMINRSREDILKLFAESKVAIHTMKEEHFGISIVEMMSAGLITIAHDSAGPKMDIIGGAE